MSERYVRPAKARIVVDTNACALCQTCALFCSMGKWSEVSPELGCMDINIDYFNGEIDISMCYQCNAPSCAEVCPRSAIAFNEECGCYVVDQELCIGCGTCAAACPRQAISLNKTRRKAAKCDLCGACVEVCPEKAIKMVPLNKFGRLVEERTR